MTREPEYADPQRYIDLVGFRGGWRDLFWNADFLDLVARRLRLAEVKDALDVGCGAGHWGRALLPHLPASARLVGVDREEAFLALAREAADPRRTEYRVGTAEALPFDDASFDLVTCQTLLIHVRDPAVAIAEMKRVLRPGGVLLAAGRTTARATSRCSAASRARPTRTSCASWSCSSAAIAASSRSARAIRASAGACPGSSRRPVSPRSSPTRTIAPSASTRPTRAAT
ncbi:MAG: class I SAM-dependent methyltransferase [Sandaracinaceae bacterium]|nr:class I SAM-dependent methyltransferase [Sandaracinaceae bacterium]